MQSRRDVFQAIADPTRRDILIRLLQKPQNVNSLVSDFKMTRQAISLHVKILEECKVMKIKQSGRERICTLNARKMKEIVTWLQPFGVVSEVNEETQVATKDSAIESAEMSAGNTDLGYCD